jgi:hypothetical protein
MHKGLIFDIYLPIFEGSCKYVIQVFEGPFEIMEHGTWDMEGVWKNGLQ